MKRHISEKTSEIFHMFGIFEIEMDERNRFFEMRVFFGGGRISALNLPDFKETTFRTCFFPVSGSDMSTC